MTANIQAALAQPSLLDDMMRAPHEGEPQFYRSNLKHAAPLILAEHYSKRCPGDPMHVFVWAYGNEVVAAATFSSPVNRFFGGSAIELTRLVRASSLSQPLSRFISLCLRWLKQNTNLAYCLSYADSAEGHVGTVYQAANFIFVAETKGNTVWQHTNGSIVSGRAFDQRGPHNKEGWVRSKSAPKLLYVYPLAEKQKVLLERFGWKALPYRKAAPC